MKTDDPRGPADSHPELDLVTVFRSAGTTAEMEALAVQALLESSGIRVILMGDSRLPNLPDEIRVARADADRAIALIAEAESVGPKGAEEAELREEAGEKLQ